MNVLHCSTLYKVDQNANVQTYNDGRLSIKNVSNTDGGQYKLDMDSTRTVQNVQESTKWTLQGQ